jgi:hypothetical protein
MEVCHVSAAIGSGETGCHRYTVPPADRQGMDVSISAM